MLEQATSSSSKVPLTFLNLIGYSEAEGQEDLADLFGRAQQAFRSKKLSRTEFKLRWLLNRWVRMLRLDASEWRATILLRGLFVESLGWSQLAHLLKLSEARVRSLSLDALLEQVSPEDFLSRPTRDCARNDLYLLDVLTRQTWTDRLGIYPQSHFEGHLSDCERCRRVFEKTQRYQLSLKNTRLMSLPAQLEWKERTALENSESSMGLSRFPLPMRALATLVFGIVIFLGVISTPYLGKYLKVSKESVPLVTATEKRDLVEIEKAMPLETPAPGSGVAKVEESLEHTTPAPLKELTEAPMGSFASLKQKILGFMQPTPKSPELVASVPPPEVPAQPAPPNSAPVVASTPPLEQAPSVVASTPTPKVVEVATPKPSATAGTGTSKIFFRWGARAEDPDRVTQKVLAWLNELNAKNAGELEFGALYRGGRYFHFLVSKSDYANLLGNIKTLPLTDFTDSAADSDRVIPGDQSRIVFWIGPSGR